jgi:hypothetical protein
MQPSPLADTSKLLLPSLRFCVVVSIDSESTSTRQQPNRRGSRPRTYYGVDDCCLVAAVFGAVRSVDRVVEPGINVGKDYFPLDSAGADAAFVTYLAGADAAFVTYLGATKPAGGAPAHGPDAELVADADHPDGRRLSLCAVASDRSDPQFFCGSDLVELLARPRGHWAFLSDFIQRSIGLVLFVADPFRPIDGLVVKLFHDRDMRHCGGRRRAVPMLLAERTPDHVPGPDFLFGLSPALRPAASAGDEQRLPERMGMLLGARTGLERHQCAVSAGGIGRVEQGIDPYATGEIPGRSLAGRPWSASFDFRRCCFSRLIRRSCRASQSAI